MAESDPFFDPFLKNGAAQGRFPSGSGGTSSSATLAQPALETWARSIPASTPHPLFIALRGPLGAGKSVLARAIARGAGVEGPMPSPTYNLLFSYEGAGGVAVRHLDLYRLNDPDDVWELGWRELGEGDEIVLVEWPERAESLLPADRWDVRLETPDSGDDAATLRRVTVTLRGAAPTPPPLPADDRPAPPSAVEDAGSTPAEDAGPR